MFYEDENVQIEHLIFFDELQKDLMSSQKILYDDGSFSVVPKTFEQLYILNGFISDSRPEKTSPPCFHTNDRAENRRLQCGKSKLIFTNKMLCRYLSPDRLGLNMLIICRSTEMSGFGCVHCHRD